jgi:enoyl-CoA hydratase/carnithine racemase
VHLAVASEQATFAKPEINIGIPPHSAALNVCRAWRAANVHSVASDWRCVLTATRVQMGS